MAINWGMAGQNNNALAYFQLGQQMGGELRQRREERDLNNALATFQANPNDPKALQAVTQKDPRLGMQLQQQMSAQQAEEAKKRAEMLGQAAQWADTPEKWDTAIDYLAQQGFKVEQYKGKFSPESRMAAIASAGELKAYLDRQAPVNVGPGSHLVDPATGKPIFSAPFAPRPVTVKDGETVVEYTPGTGDKSLDQVWQGMIQTESRGNHFGSNGAPLTSPKGAVGIAQVMPGTAPEAAALAGLPFDENRYRTDPEYNAAIGRAYFEKQVQTFGDIEKAVAAYNAGPGNVQKAIQKGGANWKDFLPAETKGYLTSVLGPAGSRVIAQGAPKQTEQWRTMTPEEAQGMGLPPGMVYQRSPSGEIKPIGGQPKAALTAQQSAAVKQKLNDTLQIENQLARVEKAMTAAEEKGWTGYVGGRVPGGLDAESDTFDKSVRLLATMVRKLTRTPGEGAMSDYESRLAEMTLPSRTDTKEGRREALAGIRELIASIKMGYGELASSAPSQPAPAAKGGWGKAKVVQ